ncbi:O-methylsterigmatocystin oxidoreductase [Termitomyces sp. T112]|nr:O-methylsterigmatocystin oxidoreductase [Termitomyces sp. T112]
MALRPLRESIDADFSMFRLGRSSSQSARRNGLRSHHINSRPVLKYMWLPGLHLPYNHIHLFLRLWRTPSHIFPPGPPTRPLIGNIFYFKTRGAWVDLTKFKDEYGDLVFFHGLGSKILVLNTLEVIEDLCDKRAAIYSNRPLFTVVSELMGLGQSIPLLPYGKKWRELRKMAHAALSLSATKKYHTTQEDLSALLNLALLNDPADFFSHVRLAAGRIVLAVTYGLSAEIADRKYIAQAEETLEIIGKATVPGAYLCDLFPILKYCPSWFPFQREAAHGKKLIETLVAAPFNHVKQSMREGTALPSLTHDLLMNTPAKDRAGHEYRVKWTAGSMFGAGGETTYATVLNFLMAMVLNPEKQRIAHAEIDRVVGNNRLPVIADRNDLPYVNAVIKETMRWHPSLPLSIARASTEDNFYRGYFIPKGTIIVPNAWAVAFETNDQYNVKAFIPERFLGLQITTIDPGRWAFGFGRRICPGKTLAENSLFALISTIIAAFDILPPAEGVLEPRFGLDLISYPQPFNCRIVPRSLIAAELVRQRAAASTV